MAQEVAQGIYSPQTVKCLFGSSVVDLHLRTGDVVKLCTITAVVTHDVARVAAAVKPWRAVRSLDKVTVCRVVLGVPSLLTLPLFMSLGRL